MSDPTNRAKAMRFVDRCIDGLPTADAANGAADELTALLDEAGDEVKKTDEPAPEDVSEIVDRFAIGPVAADAWICFACQARTARASSAPRDAATMTHFAGCVVARVCAALAVPAAGLPLRG